MFSCCKHVYAPELSILNVWDILKPQNYLFLPVSKCFFDKQFCHLNGFIAVLNILAAGPCNKNY